jgi:hypothetical protein
MLRYVVCIAVCVAFLLAAAVSTQASQYGTADEAKAMLARAVAAVGAGKAKALDMFNKGAEGFKDRDLYVLCADATDGVITASPTSNGRRLTDFPPGKEVMRTASQGKVSEITYRWPRPGSIMPLEKHTFYTKVGDQICGVGYYD